jgi:hypothetical protein
MCKELFARAQVALVPFFRFLRLLFLLAFTAAESWDPRSHVRKLLLCVFLIFDEAGQWIVQYEQEETRVNLHLHDRLVSLETWQAWVELPVSHSELHHRCHAAHLCRYQLAMAGGWLCGRRVTLEVLGADTILLYSIGAEVGRRRPANGATRALVGE